MNKKIRTATEDDNQLFYKLIRKQRSTLCGSTELMVDDNLITENEDLLKAWADHFERLATLTDDPTFDSDFKSTTENSFDIIREFTSLNTNSKTIPVSTVEVLCAMSMIRKLKTKKASDINGGSAEHIIHADEALAPILTTLFRQMRRMSYIPQQLKKGYIIPLPKKGKNSMLQDNYRGITTTSTFSKLGLLRTTSESNKALIDEMLKLARRTTYMFMGEGLHGKNGISPVVSNRMLNVFVLPRYLHDIETIKTEYYHDYRSQAPQQPAYEDP